MGQKTSQSDALGHPTLVEYDLLGRVIKQTTPDGTITEATYDPTSNVLTSKVNGQVMASHAYDDAGRLASTTDVMGWQTLFTYYDNNLKATSTRKNPSTGATFVLESNSYDKAGHLISRVTNNGVTVENTAVDAAGRIASQTVDPAGVNRTVSYVYGPDDTVLSHTVSGPTGSQTVDAQYDAAGRMIWQGIRLPSGTGGPAGWWQLNETMGTTAADSTASARNGTLSGGATWSQGGLGLDGTGKVATSGSVLSTNQSYTISAWAKASPTTTIDSAAVSQQGSIASAFFLGYAKSTGQWAFATYHTDTTYPGITMAVSTAPAATDTWVLLTGVRDIAAGTIKLYLDGTLQATVAAPAGFATSGPLMIGDYKYNGGVGNYFKGAVDNVQAYQRALTAAEINSLYTGGRSGSAISSAAITSSLTRDKLGRVTTQTDPNGNVTNLSYDQANRLVVTTSPTVSTEDNGVVTTAPIVTMVGYDTFGSVVETKDGKGRQMLYKRDANGQVFQTHHPSYTQPGPGSTFAPVTKAFYDNMGRIDNVEDPLGRKTFYTYNQFGQVLTLKAPDLGITTYTYHPNGDVASVTDPSGARSEATYDYLRRQVTATQFVRHAGQPTEALTSTALYNTAGGWLTSTTTPDPARKPATYTYNNVGEPIQVKDFFNNTTTFAYDFAGRQTLVTAPDGSKQTAGFDSAGRTVSGQRYDPAGTLLSSVSATYDAAGNLVTSKDPAGTVSTLAYNAIGQLTQATQPISGTDSITTTFGYDATGNRTRYTDGRGNPFLTTYNSWGLPESQIEPGGATFTTVYDDAARVAESRSPGGVSLAYTYDLMDNVTRIAGSGAEIATTDRVYTYDTVGRPVTLSGPGGTNTLSYDDRDLLESVTGPTGNSSFTYTADGLMASRVDTAGTTSYTYDENGRLKTTANSTAGLDLAYTYNSLSQVSQITYGSNQNRRVFSYDGLQRLTVDELKTSAGTSIGKITYGWDANDNETSKTTVGFAGAGANTYTYDLANRLTSWNGTTYVYDKSSNRTQAGAKTFTYNASNRLVSASDGTTYEYTARGTLSKTTVGTVGLDTVSDAFGQVIKQYSTATAFSQYDYDGLGRVVQAGFAYTGLGNDLAKDATSTYVRDPGGAVAGSKTGAWAVYAWTDLHTDVVGQFSAAATTLAGSRTYEPYGKVSTSTGMQGNLGYQSGWTDSQTKRVNMHARWYNPDTGQFDSRDTDSVPNRFNYADNNPLVNTDPTGHGPVNYRDRELVSGVPGVGARYVNDDWEHWQTHRRNQRAYEQQQKLIAKENARVAKLIRELPSCMKQEKKVQGRPVEEAAGCEGAMKTCDKATGSRFARYESDQTTMLKNCTRVDVNPDGSCAINDFFFKKSDSRCQDPKLIAAMIDNFVGRRGGYMPDGQPGDRAHLTGILVNRAVEGVAAQRTAEKVQACQADRWCRNRETISTVVEVVVAVAFTAACTVATGGVGLPLCALIGAGIGGFTGGVAEARAEGLAWDDPWLWDRGVNRGIAAAAMAAALAPIGGLFALAAKPLASLVGRLLATTAGRTIAGTGARLAEVKAIQTLGNVARSRWGSCALDVGTEVGMAVATAAHSFAPHTKVLKGDGTTTKIKDIKLGDKVVATDPATDQTSTQPVTALHVNLDRDLVDVEVRPTHSSGEGGGDRSTRGPTATLHTTSHHPFWDTATNQWVNAANLKPGHSTLTGPDGQTSQVVTVRKVFGFNQMHDLTVDNIHTYYVMAGDSPVLVHNCNGSTNSHLDGLPVHPDINKFNVRAGELVNNRFETHPLNPHQMNGGEVVGHDGVRNLRNDQLIMPGGPQGNDPIRGTRDWAPGDCSCFPGSRIYITGGHHRTAEIARRVQAGDMDPNTLIEFWISPP